MDKKSETSPAGISKKANDRAKRTGLFLFVVLLLLVVANFIWKSESTTEIPLEEEGVLIAMVDFTKVRAAHRATSELARLEDERRQLVEEIERLLSIRRAVTAPALDEAPFEMAEEQKERQELRIKEAGLQKENEEALKRWDEENEPRFFEKRKALEAEYQNRIVNLEMKLDNADAMGLSPAEREAYYNELSYLRSERGGRIRLVFEEYLAARKAYADSLVLKSKTALLTDVAATQAAAAEKKNAAETRNTENMRDEMQDVEIATLIRQKEATLAAKIDEIEVIESHIRRDIESRAEKLAIVHHLDIIYAGNTVPYLVGLPGQPDGTEAWTPTWLPVGAKVLDLTEELIKELSE